jgi:hypothetical protein
VRRLLLVNAKKWAEERLPGHTERFRKRPIYKLETAVAITPNLEWFQIMLLQKAAAHPPVPDLRMKRRGVGKGLDAFSADKSRTT